MANQVNVRVGVTGAKEASTDVDKLRDKFDKLQKQGAKGFAIGAGAAVTAAGLNLIGNAATDLLGVVNRSVDAAIEDEHSITKLGASLKANVPNWNGNTDAIERLIHKQMALGFSDEDQRDSLAKLVGATHDVNKAFEVQRVAMDLARFKGISLAEATDGLTKVEAGSYRILKSLGIVLKDGATQTEALAAVESVAAGQAEAFANTNEGKLVRSQIAVNEAMEKFGKAILPVVAEAANDVSFALDRTLVPLEKLQAAANAGPPAARVQLEELTKAAQDNQVSVEDLYDAWSGSGQSIEEAAKSLNSEVSHQLDGMADKGGASFGKLTTAARDMASDGKHYFGNYNATVEAFTTNLERLANEAISGYFDPIIEHDQLMADEARLSAAKRVLASKTATKAEKTDAKATIHELERSTTELRVKLALAGQLSKKEQATLLRDLKADWAHATGAAKTKIAELIAAIESIPENTYVNVHVASNLLKPKKKYAAGGHYAAGEPRMVGENGPEVDIPDHGGTIIPNNQLGSTGGSAVGGVNLTIHVSAGAWSPGQAEQWARQVTPHIAREFQRQGLIAR